ncbi:pilus assembly protein PilM [Candidatus Parcubacteria bacterium]|jgi:type IV pilus assembly protein PilM|nr:pilus assembly protein PilM [Candidatus Parcubacteria bacterium]
MAKNVIGIDISDFSIEAVILDKKKGRFVVDTYSRFRLSPDIVEDGKIVNSEKLKDALQRLFKNAQPKPIKGDKKVFLSIPESKVFTRILTLPKNLKEKEIHEAAEHKAEEIVPEAPENLVPAMKLLAVQGDNREVFYTEAEIEIVNDFVRVCKDLDIEIEGITTESISSFSGLSDELKKQTTLMLDIGARTTIASIFDANGIRSSVNINIAGNNITSSLVKKMSISHSAAEDAKHKYGMTAAEDGGVMMIIQGQLQPLVDELKKFINYYQENFGERIEHLVLIGGLAQMKGIDKYFGDNLNMQAHIGQSFVANEMLPEHMTSTKYINALGLARLAHEKTDINFYTNLSKQEKKQKEPKKEKKKAGADDSGEPPFYKNKLFVVFLIVLLLVGTFFVYKFFIQSDNTTDVSENKVISQPLGGDNLPAVDIEAGLKLSKQIIVGDVPQEEENFILGKHFEVIEEVVFQSESDMDYATAFETMLRELAVVISDKVNTEHIREGYYIIPLVFEQIEDSSLPSEEEYVAGDSLSAVITSKFLAVPENSIRTLMLAGMYGAYADDVVDNFELIFTYDLVSKSITNDSANMSLEVDMVLQDK